MSQIRVTTNHNAIASPGYCFCLPPILCRAGRSSSFFCSPRRLRDLLIRLAASQVHIRRSLKFQLPGEFGKQDRLIPPRHAAIIGTYQKQMSRRMPLPHVPHRIRLVVEHMHDFRRQIPVFRGFHRRQQLLHMDHILNASVARRVNFFAVRKCISNGATG